MCAPIAPIRCARVERSRSDDGITHEERTIIETHTARRDPARDALRYDRGTLADLDESLVHTAQDNRKAAARGGGRGTVH